ncbi:gliding motility-associated C-terminal domain-containing protein [bacterium SCSIO 12741]|nr:gliding motility-associated C-terminal domain-containing protein [bacterium SCSIO 12741]
MGDTNATDTNKTIRFFPSKTTYLEVWSDMKEGCVKASACQDRDSVKIVAARNYNVLKHSDTLICFGDSTINIFAGADSTHFTYTYEWDANPTLSNDSIANPDVTPIVGQYYPFTIISDSGCTKRDSIFVDVTPPMPKSIIATANPNPACPGTPSQINLSLGAMPTSCGSTVDQCTGALVHKSSTSTANSNGSGPSGTSNWPCPYGGGQVKARQQFLYTAAELSAMGIGAGIIDGLGFNVVGTNGVSPMAGYTIKLKCLPANKTTLTSWEQNAVTVFNAKTVTPAAGWNMHPFDNNYNYDGNSSLLVEVCWDNSASGSSSNASVAYVSTLAPSCLADYGTLSSCTSQMLSLSNNLNRPTFQVSYCGARDPKEFTYKWTPSTGLNFDTLQNPEATINSTDSFTVLVTDTFGKCSDDAGIKILVAELEIGNDTAICAGDSLQLNTTYFTGCGQSTFSWTPASAFNDPSIPNPKVSLTQTTVIKLTYTDTCSCTIVDSITVFADSVKANGTLTDPNCQTGQGSIAFSPTGGVKPYLFTIDGGLTWSTDSLFNSLTIGTYTLQVQDSMGCLSDTTVDVLYNQGAPVIDSVSLQNLTCYDNGTGQITVHATGGVQPLSFSIDSGVTWSNSATFTGLSAGSYIVFARGANGCKAFPEFDTLTQPNQLQYSFSTFIDSCYKQGDGWAIASGSGGTGPYTYTWSGSWSGATHPPQVVQDSAFTKLFAYNGYSMEVSDANGCKLDTTFTITEIPELIVDSLDYVAPTCYGYGDAELHIKGKGGNGMFFFSLDSGSNYYPPTSGADSTYAMLDSSVTKTHVGAKTYQVFVRDQKGCKGNKAITVTEPPLMVLTTPQDSTTVCVSTCAKLEVFSTGGNSPQHQYHWTPSVSSTNVANVCPDANSIYSVYATDNRGCASNGLLMKVNLFDSLSIEMPNDTAICKGSNTKLKAKALGGKGDGYKYLWQPFVGLSNAFIAQPNASPEKTTTYYLMLSDECGTPEVMDSVTIAVMPQPVVDFSSDTAAGCPPLTVGFQNLTNASAKCEWSFGDETSATTCRSVDKTYTQSGKYDVKLVVTSTDGCVDSLVRKNYMDVYEVPTASFSMSPQPTTLLDTRIKFRDESDGKLVEWQWNFAGLDTAMQRNTQFTFPSSEAGNYPVRLDVINNLGCKDDTIMNLVIRPDFYIYVPTSFTPNGDGKNDVWKPIGTGFELDFYHVMVYDRWGGLVFESRDYNESWDGTVGKSGESAPVGVYTWKLITGDAKDEKNRHEELGTVTIVK